MVGFRSDLPSKSLYPKRARSSNHRSRSRKEQQQRLCKISSPLRNVSDATGEGDGSADPADTPLGESSDSRGAAITHSLIQRQFDFVLGDWQQKWCELRSTFNGRNMPEWLNALEIESFADLVNPILPLIQHHDRIQDLSGKMKNLCVSKDVPSRSHQFAKSKSMPKLQYFPIMDLPGEIREIIYWYALENESTDSSEKELVPVRISHSKKTPNRTGMFRISPTVSSILYSCKRFLHEGLPIFYRRNNFYFTRSADPKVILRLGRDAFCNIRHLSIFLGKSALHQADLFAMVQWVSQLPRLRSVEFKRWTTFKDGLKGDSHLERFTKRHNDFSESTCLQDTAHTALAQIRELSINAPKSYPFHYRFRIEFCPIKEKDRCERAAPSCVPCAILAAIAESEKARDKLRLSARGNPQIDVHICRTRPANSGLSNGALPLLANWMGAHHETYLVSALERPRIAGGRIEIPPQQSSCGSTDDTGAHEGEAREHGTGQAFAESTQEEAMDVDNEEGGVPLGSQRTTE